MADRPGRTWKATCLRCKRKGHLAKTCDRQQITANGETLSLEEWAGRIGIDHDSLRMRLYRGMPPEEAVTRPRGWKRSKETV